MSKVFNPLLPYGQDEVGTPGVGTGTVTTVQDEGTTVSSAAAVLNFVGSGVTVTDVAGVMTVTIPGSGGSLAVQDYSRDWASATTYYEGIAPKGTAASATGWSLIKTTVTGNNLDTRSIYTATDTWNNRASATYTLSNSYST